MLAAIGSVGVTMDDMGPVGRDPTLAVSLPSTAVPARRPRLAIVSTFDELCGIAAYTQALVRQLGDAFELKVFDLDQFLLRGPGNRVRKEGDAHIRRMCAEFAAYDFVNIQLEHGTLGRGAADILRRFRMLVDAAPAVTVTFHTVLQPERLGLGMLLQSLARLRFDQAGTRIGARYRRHLLVDGLYRCLRRAQRTKPLRIIVHTHRDMLFMKHVNRFDSVFHHPLAFLQAEDVRQIRAGSNRQQFPVLQLLPRGARLIGVFGFLSRYKGFDTAIRALRHLPPEYHLLIFGGTHPQELKREQRVDKYIAELLGEAGALPRRDASDGDSPLLSRVHFMGALDDKAFRAGMVLCDSVVLPYLEVGQSSSGTLSQALELGCRVIVARTNAFLQFGRYHPDTIEYFDIGNHLELAERIRSPVRDGAQWNDLAYNTDTNRALYLQAHRR